MELLDGVVIDLLKTKWDTFVKSRFYKQFYMFSFYFLFSLVSFILRPGPPDKEEETEDSNDKSNPNVTHYANSRVVGIESKTLAYSKPRVSRNHFMIMKKTRNYFITETFWLNFSEHSDNEVVLDDLPTWWESYAECPLMNMDNDLAKVKYIKTI